MRQAKLSMYIEMALFASMASILDKLTIDFMPQGGGVSLAIIPIALIAVRWGFVAGCTTGLLVGLVDVATGVTVYHWAQVFLDHCLANIVIGLIALCNKPIHEALRTRKKRRMQFTVAIGLLFACFCKFIVHVVSGVIFFSMYANGQNVWIYSIVYNATPMIPTTIVCIIGFNALLLAAPKLVQRSKHAMAMS